MNFDVPKSEIFLKIILMKNIPHHLEPRKLVDHY